MPHAAEHVTSSGLDNGLSVCLERSADGEIRGDEEPTIATVLDYSATGAVREGVGVVGPVNCRWRANVSGQARRCRAGREKDPILSTRDLLHGKSYRGVRHIHN